MPNYRRAVLPGGTFFFTVVTHRRQRILTDEAARTALRHAIARTRHDHPFELEAIVILPDHLHALWTLPPDDTDFSTRWRLIKSRFTREWLAVGRDDNPAANLDDVTAPEQPGTAGLPSRPTRRDGGRPETAGLSSRPTGLVRVSRGERAVWQQRFWEHRIRDDDDLARHLDYIHYNPVKHGLASCPHAWPWSSFERMVADSIYPRDWCCACNAARVVVPDFSWATDIEME